MPDLCRSCGAPLIWARTASSRWIPLDAAPVDPNTAGPTFVLRERSQPKPLAVAIPPEAAPGESYFRAHFATCPDADAWRGAKQRAERALGTEL